MSGTDNTYEAPANAPDQTTLLPLVTFIVILFFYCMAAFNITSATATKCYNTALAKIKHTFYAQKFYKFLELPPELRLNIIAMYLEAIPYEDSKRFHKRTSFRPPLLRVSRQIRKEARKPYEKRLTAACNAKEVEYDTAFSSIIASDHPDLPEVVEAKVLALNSCKKTHKALELLTQESTKAWIMLTFDDIEESRVEYSMDQAAWEEFSKRMDEVKNTQHDGCED